jgi:Uma2 family endonuclease
MRGDRIKNDRHYTFEDYLALNDGKRWEIIDGALYLAAPKEGAEHKEVLGYLFSQFYIYSKDRKSEESKSPLAIRYLRGKKCAVYATPFDVRLPKHGETFKNASSIVTPDITIISDMGKLDSKGYKGSPDMIIEILSPWTAKIDKVIKFNLYERHGVREYWIVDPVNQLVNRFSYDGNLREYMKADLFGRDDIITPVIFPELEINLEDVFPEIVEEDDEDTIRI